MLTERERIEIDRELLAIRTKLMTLGATLGQRCRSDRRLKNHAEMSMSHIDAIRSILDDSPYISPYNSGEQGRETAESE